MNSEATCRKVVLADEAACRVVYCRHCNVAEVLIGAVSLRFDAEALRLFAHGLTRAAGALERMATPVSMTMPAEWAGAGNVH